MGNHAKTTAEARYFAGRHNRPDYQPGRKNVLRIPRTATAAEQAGWKETQLATRLLDR